VELRLTSAITTIENVSEHQAGELNSTLKLIRLKQLVSAILIVLPLLWSISANAQISYVNSWNGSTQGEAGLAINTGIGTQATVGSLLVAAITAYDFVTISPPNSTWATAVPQWTYGAMNSVIFYKVAASGDVGATFTFTTGGYGAYLSGGIIALSGENQSSPIDSAGTGSDGAGVVTASGISTSLANDWLLWFGTSEENSGSVSVPGGYSTAWDIAGSSSTEGSTLGYNGPVSTGPTGPVAGGSASAPWQGAMIGVEPGTQTTSTAPSSPPPTSGNCSTLTTLSSTGAVQITASDVAQFPFLGSPYIGYCPPLDPIDSIPGISCLTSNLNTPTKMIFPLESSTGWCPTQNNPQQGYYWGRVIGADGLFFQGATIDQAVGFDTTSKPYQLARQFQQYYAPWGASNNLYFINLEGGPLNFDGTEWYTPTYPAMMVQDVQEAAALANYAGFVGLAFNFERHDEFWGYDPNLPNKGQIIQQFGASLGQAILTEFPNANILEFPNCPIPQNPATITAAQRNQNGYYYYPEFCYGFMLSQFTQLALGGEDTWYTDAAGDNPIPFDFASYDLNYWPAIQALGIPVSQVTNDPGFWPLGHPYKNPATGTDVVLPDNLLEYTKAATVNTTPATWQMYISSAYSYGPPYTWIFDLAWSYELTPNDPFETGPLDPNFATYINELHALKQQYAQ
jgi:hypothetical protein